MALLRNGAVLALTLLAGISNPRALYFPLPGPDLRKITSLDLILEPRCELKPFKLALELIYQEASKKLRDAGLAIHGPINPETADDRTGALVIYVHCARVEPNGSAIALRTYSPGDDVEEPRGPYVFHVTAEFSMHLWLSSEKIAHSTSKLVVWSHRWSGFGAESKPPFAKLRANVLDIVDVFLREVKPRR